MFKFSNILPFSSVEFYFFILFSILFVFVIKFFFQKKINYSHLIATISGLYLLLLFPKPFHFIVFILYGYLIFKILGVKLKIMGIFPVLCYLLPLFLMKLTNVLSLENTTNSFLSQVFQIAGLSYATFKMIQVYIDEKENVEAGNFINYFNFIAFVPTLLIGPLDRFSRFQSDVDHGFKNINLQNFNKGFEIFIKGILYKYIFAFAILSLIINHLENNNSITYHLSYMYSYLFYLFFDFAGYSLLAIGFGLMIGISVPFNFNKPFLALNPRDFWQRWHKTLGDWLNDYFFKPFFKELTSRKKFKPIQRQSIALCLTFQLMGFWNGFELNYVLSGSLFGIYSVVHNYYNYLCKKNQKEVFFGNLQDKYVKFLSMFVMFNLVAFSIYVFSGKLV
jgi:membrane protein involved in D-alanine export